MAASASMQYSNNGVFYSNQELEGFLILDVKKTLQIQKIFIRIKGKAVVTWKENGGDFWYRAGERYIDINHIIYDEDSYLNLHPGQHRYDFTHMLPAILPASFESTSGRVYYSCEAIAEGVQTIPIFTPRKQKVKKPFTVIPTIPFGTLSNANVMITRHANKVLYTCCWSVGLVKASLRVNRGAFIPGEKISFNVEISNQSIAHLNNLEAKLKRMVTCKARKCSKRDENTVISSAQCLSTVSPNENFVWKNGTISIPKTAPTDLGGCQIISVTYHLKVKIGGQTTSCFSPGIVFKVPIVIGTVPKDQATESIAEPSIVTSQPTSIK